MLTATTDASLQIRAGGSTASAVEKRKARRSVSSPSNGFGDAAQIRPMSVEKKANWGMA